MMSAIRSLSGEKRTFNETTGAAVTLPPHHWQFGITLKFVQTLDRRPIKTRHALREVEFSHDSSATPRAGERRSLSIC